MGDFRSGKGNMKTAGGGSCYGWKETSKRVPRENAGGVEVPYKGGGNRRAEKSAQGGKGVRTPRWRGPASDCAKVPETEVDFHGKAESAVKEGVQRRGNSKRQKGLTTWVLKGRRRGITDDSIIAAVDTGRFSSTHTRSAASTAGNSWEEQDHGRCGGRNPGQKPRKSEENRDGGTSRNTVSAYGKQNVYHGWEMRTSS